MWVDMCPCESSMVLLIPWFSAQGLEPRCHAATDCWWLIPRRARIPGLKAFVSLNSRLESNKEEEKASWRARERGRPP